MRNIRESDVQEWLAFLLRGRREQVLVDLGRVDILLHEDGVDYVIEVKKGSKFLHAIGQVIGYTTRLEKDQKNVERVRIIALFGWRGMHPNRIQECQDICDRMNIRCWLLDENFLEFMYLLERSHAESGKDMRPRHFFMEQYMSNRVKEQRRLEFHNRMKRGEIEDIVFEEDSDESEDIDSKEDNEATPGEEVDVVAKKLAHTHIHPKRRKRTKS